jgi:hypothetical protein
MAREPPLLSAPTKSGPPCPSRLASMTTGTLREIAMTSASDRLRASTTSPSTLPATDSANSRPEAVWVAAIRTALPAPVAARSAPRITWST